MYGVAFVYLLCHVIIHVVCFLSIFDIYFTTTIIPDVKSVELEVNPLARRLVLFVADGLRSDKFFENGIERAPHLRDVASHKGTWGVSLARAPTESRPAHVAMLGGFNEDPSAIKALWKDNPVEFDTVFNRSRETWAWGASDVLPYLNKGSARFHVHIDCHNYHLSELSKLDEWVFDRVNIFFVSAKKNETLRQKLSRDKLVFFLHLAGIDSNGHRFDSQARPYLDNIGVVDDGIRKTVQRFDEFYDNDGKTAYIFTADHGMTDPGGHGGSHPTEVHTPLVAWGSGINVNVNSSGAGRLGQAGGIDVDQVDLSALMTSLIGVPFPDNSRGSLPLRYLSADTCTKAQLAKTRAIQLGEQFFAKIRYSKQHLFRVFFWYFENMELNILEMNAGIEKLIASNRCDEANVESSTFFHYSFQALEYYKSLRKVAICSVIITFLAGWMVVTAVVATPGFQLHHHLNASMRSQRRKSIASLGVAIFVFVFLYNTEVAWTYYFYCLLPVLLWHVVVSRLFTCFTKPKERAVPLVWYVLFALALSWTMMLSFYQRQYLSAGLLVVSGMPYVFRMRRKLFLSAIWAALCLSILIFPMLPAADENDAKKGIVLLAGIISSVLCCVVKFRRMKNGHSDVFRRTFCIISLCTAVLPAVAGCIVFVNSGYTMVAGKVVLISSWVVPVMSGGTPLDRLVKLYCWQSSVYIFLSHSYDAMFFVGLSVLLYVWIFLEGGADQLLPTHHRGARDTTVEKNSENFANHDMKPLDAVRQSTVLIFLVLLGFHGVYNIESFYKFNTRKLPFLPVTDQPTLVVLFGYKIFLHYLMISSCLCVISVKVGIPLRTYWCVTAMFCDFMFMHFLCWVKDTGSWEEMGSSIANLGVVTGLALGMLIILSIAKALNVFKLPLRRKM